MSQLTKEQYHEQYYKLQDDILELDAKRVRAQCTILETSHAIELKKLDVARLNSTVAIEGYLELPGLGELEGSVN